MDLTVFNKLASSRVMYSGVSPVLSNNPYLGRLSFDKTSVFKPKVYTNLAEPLKK
jgi:hypothetical protein